MIKYRTLLLTIVSIITTIAINIDNNGQSFVWIIYAFFLYHILNKVLEIKDKRLIICSCVLAVLLASFAALGNSINNFMGLGGIIASPLKALLKWFGYIVIISSTIILLYDKLNQWQSKKEVPISKKSFFICWGIIFVAWFPYLLQYFPGIATPDSVDQIKQAVGIGIKLTSSIATYNVHKIGNDNRTGNWRPKYRNTYIFYNSNVNNVSNIFICNILYGQKAYADMDKNTRYIVFRTIPSKRNL